jgi:CheY-like chemotaxis protein
MTSHRKLVLLVEDDNQRAAAIKACIPPDIHCVWAKSAGAAFGVLRRDKFSGIMLDFDLYRSAVGDPQFTGESVAAEICETQGRHCEIFIHSQNPSGARRAFELLKQAGFSVEQCPWSAEAVRPLKCWLEDLSDLG